MDNESTTINATDELPTDYELPESPYSLPVKVTLGVAAIVITVVAIVGNALILTAFFTTARLRRLTNYFYASLALTDLAAGLLVMPFMASYTLLYYWSFGKPFCVVWLCVDMFVYSASVYHMCAICLDRFLAITFPLKYRLRRSKKLILGFIATAWALALAFEVPATLIYEHVAGRSVVAYAEECDVEWVEDAAVTVVSFLVTVVIPFLFTLVLYIHIFVTIRRSHRYSKPGSSKTKERNGNKGEAGGCFICKKGKATKAAELGQVDDIEEVELEVANNRLKRCCEAMGDFVMGLCRRRRCWSAGQSSYDVTSNRKTFADDVPRASCNNTSINMVGFRQRELARVTLAHVSASACEEVTCADGNYLADSRSLSGSDGVISGQGDDERCDGNATPSQNELADSGFQNNAHCYVNRAMSTESIAVVSMPTDKQRNDTLTVDLDEGQTERLESQLKSQTERDGQARAEQAESTGNDESNKPKLQRFRQISTVLVSVLKQRANSQGERTPGQNNRQEVILAKQKAKERRAAATLGILLGVFLITWLPWKITTIADSIARVYLFPDVWYEIAIWLQYSNSMINPFLYMFRDREFRVAIKRILCRLACRRSSHNTGKSSSGDRIFVTGRSTGQTTPRQTSLSSDSVL